MSTIIECPVCSQGLEIEDYREGAALECPSCGHEFTTPKAWAPKEDILGSLSSPSDKLLQEQGAGTGAGSSSEAAPVLPERLKNILHESEQVLYMSNPSKNSLILGMILTGVMWGLIGFFVCMMGIAAGAPAILLLPMTFALPLAISLAATYFSWKNRFYIITDSRTIVSEGVLNIATRIVMNKNIQFISINTGMIDRWLHLNSVELATAANGGGNVINALIPQSAGSVTLKCVKVEDVLKHYWNA